MIQPLSACADPKRYGGKAAQLAAALGHGLPVPDGFALEVSAAAAVARGSALALPEGFWAVRSSSVDEDGEAASFAGQHISLLHVSSDDVAGAVWTVWASGRTEAALAYRARMGIAHPPRMAIVIQRMVYPETAGVLFTRNPITGARERMIEASWGLGEAVVSGLVTPDNYRVAKGGEILARRVGFKDVAVRHERTGGTSEVPVAEHLREVLCLRDAHLAILDALAERVEQSFDGDHDIEWAFDASGVHLLQRRAITTQ